MFLAQQVHAMMKMRRHIHSQQLLIVKMTRDNAQGHLLVMDARDKMSVFLVGWTNMEISVMDFALQPNARRINSVVRFLVTPSPDVPNLLYVYLK